MPESSIARSQSLALLHAIGSAIIRPDGQAPGFGESDPDGAILAIAVGQLGRRIDPILAALGAIPSADPRELADELADSDPDLFAELRDLLVCAYLSTPALWRLLGYGGRVPRPATDGEADSYLAGGILDPVRARGPIYRLPPQDAADEAVLGGHRPSPDREETSHGT